MNIKDAFDRSVKLYVETIKRRNTVLDSFFYDVSSLEEEERQKLKLETNLEGTILVMSPISDNRSYATYPTAKKFLESEHKEVCRFVISGVGSSDLGGAALARNVADHFGEDVAVIIAGYGVTDVLTEGLGGWFSLGAINRLAYYLEKAGEAMTPEDGLELDADIHPYVAGHPDSRTLLCLLMSKKAKIDFILGHSKGCLSLANALNGFVSFGSKKLIQKRAREIQIVTTGSVIELPDVFKKVSQYLGNVDWLGGMNSRIDLPYLKVPGAWHHTNTRLPFAMNIADVLSKSG
ncbi:MAG: hypothetical protein GY847_24970 [Proteobacteria bacterium]|nr:hypothetical protein [Pseudomonadota bacterium]